MTDWAWLALVFLASCSLTWLVRQLATHNKVMDLPVARSAHQRPVPVGGGLAFIACFYLFASFSFLQQVFPFQVYMALLGGLAVAALGLLDDIYRLGVRLRLAIQFAVAIWTVLWLGPPAGIQVADWFLDIPWLIGILSVFAMVWLINLYNFMDGIDGLAGSEACFVTLVTYMIAINSSDQVTTQMSAVICVSVAGFLVFNWPPAKIFMGDAGSGFIGYILGAMALISMQNASITLWTWLLLLAVFVVDATVTLFRRVKSRQKWSMSHNTHAYQHATRKYHSHRTVTLSVLLINVFWLAPLALYATAYPRLGVYLTLLAVIPLALLAIHLNAGKSA
ncbi:MAG: glycosyltransferase family 4 protein [Pseudohongiellaceae bacterium]